MRVSREQAAENRATVVAAAARLFREHGFDGVGVDAIMKAAGLTHGGFYGQFRSKDDLIAEAVAHGLEASHARLGSRALGDFVAAYLSSLHRDDCGAGCTIAALGSEIARQDTRVRNRLTMSLCSQFDWLAAKIPGHAAAKRKRAINLVAGLVGSVILARAVDDPALSDEILAAARETYGMAAEPPA